jgi:hypothetical protein
MSTAAPSKTTGGGAGHSRSDQTSRFHWFCFYLQFLYFFKNNLEPLKVENLNWQSYGQNGMKPTLMLNHGMLEV